MLGDGWFLRRLVLLRWVGVILVLLAKTDRLSQGLRNEMLIIVVYIIVRSCLGICIVRSTLQYLSDVEARGDTNLDLTIRGIIFDWGKRLNWLSVNCLLVHYLKKSGDSCLSISIHQWLKWNKSHSNQVIALFNIKVVTSSNSLMENLEFKITSLLEPFLVEFVNRHGEVLRFEIPVGVAVTLYLRSLNELFLFSAFESWFHWYECIWFFVWIQWVLDSHSVIDFEE